MTNLHSEPLTAAAFAPFGDVLAADGPPDRLINQGFCGRYHDRARLDFGADGRAGLSVFNAQPRALPYEFALVERHPEGSQAFLPLSQHPFLVIVAPDEGGKPGAPRAFLTNGAQGINLHRGTWQDQRKRAGESGKHHGDRGWVRCAHVSRAARSPHLPSVISTFRLPAASVPSGDQRPFLGCSIVPVHFLLPHRHAQIFFRRAVCGSSRVMP